MQITKGKKTKYDDLLNTGHWKYVVKEIIVNLISPMPFLYNITYEEFIYVDQVKVRVMVNTILLILMILIRLYHIVRIVLISSYFMSSRAARV